MIRQYFNPEHFVESDSMNFVSDVTQDESYNLNDVKLYHDKKLI